jgi:hypothetical protein
MRQRTKRLADALLADRNRVAPDRTDITACFACGQGMIYKGKRFCSDRCRAGYDLGIAGHEQNWLRPRDTHRDHSGKPMKKTGDGFLIACAACCKQFNSSGAAGRTCQARSGVGLLLGFVGGRLFGALVPLLGGASRKVRSATICRNSRPSCGAAPPTVSAATVNGRRTSRSWPRWALNRRLGGAVPIAGVL